MDNLPVYEALEALNFRPLPVLDRPRIGVIPKGSLVRRLPDYAVDNAGYTWWIVHFDGKWGFAAAKYLRPFSGFSSGGAKNFGLNLLYPGADPAKFREAFKAQGGQARIWCVVNGGVVPDADLTVLRYQPFSYEPDPLSWDGRYWSPRDWIERGPMSSLLSYRTAGRRVALQFHNELLWFVDPRHRVSIPDWKKIAERRIDWERECLYQAYRMGVQITYGNFKTFGFWEQDARMLDDMVADGARYGHILRANCYWFTDIDTSSQYVGLFYPTFLMAKHPSARWVIGELGFARLDGSTAYQGAERLKALANLVVDVLGSYPNLLGVCWWVGETTMERWRGDVIPPEHYPILVERALR